jgi:hypothetical protein
MSWVLVAHAYNPSYSGGREREDCSSKPAWANSSRDPILKKPITKIGLVAQGEGPEFKPQYWKKKKKECLVCNRYSPPSYCLNYWLGIFSWLSQKSLRELDVVVHAYNLSYSEGRDWRIVVQGQPRQKVSKTLSQQISLVACGVIAAMWEA